MQNIKKPRLLNASCFYFFHNTGSNLTQTLSVRLNPLFFLVDIFFYLGFLSQQFTNHRTSGKGAGQFFNFSLALSTASQTLRH